MGAVEVTGTAEEHPGCFAYHPGWVSESEPLRERLMASLPWEQQVVTMFGRAVPTPRLTCWFGDAAYTYSGVRNVARPLPTELADLRDRLAVLTGVGLDSVLVNLYRDGSDSMGYHSDDEPELGPEPTICSVSLGARRSFSVRHQQSRRRWSWPLGAGDLLVMTGESQRDYRHAVPKTRRPVGPRINLTFRRTYG